MDLTPAQALQEWKSAKFRPVYLFIGEDSLAQKAAFDQLKGGLQPDDFNYNEFSPDAAPSDVVSACLTNPMFADRRLVVIRGPKLPAELRKSLADYLGDPLKSTTLALFSDEKKADPRDPLIGACLSLGGCVLFKPLTEDEAAVRLQAEARAAGLTLDHEAAELIVAEAGTDWPILKAELDKAILFAKGRRKIAPEDAMACLGYRKESGPFDFSNAVQARDKKLALRVARRMLEEGEDAFALLAALRSNINKQLKAKKMLKAGVAEAQIIRELRLHHYYGAEFVRKTAKLSEARVEFGARACLATEERMKSQSWLEPEIELERLIAGAL